MASHSGVDRWHDYFNDPTTAKLRDQLAEDATFYSPVVHTPQQGRDIVAAYLAAAGEVFRDTNFQYVDQIVEGPKAMLEFTVELDGIQINGIDIIQWNDEGLIESFKVLVRPMKAMNKIWEKMAAMLEQNRR